MMDATFFPFYAIGMFAGLFFFLIIIAWFCIFPLLYFWTDTPNRVLSSIFSLKVWASSVLAFVVAVGLILNDLLATIGFRSESSYRWALDDLRIEIVLLIIGGYLAFLGTKMLPNSILDTEKKEKKAPLLYTSHVFHFVSTGVLLALEIFLMAYLANWLLQFGLMGDFEQHEAGLAFFVNFITVVIPTILLGLSLYPALRQKKRFLPKIKSETCGIFALMALLVSGLLSLVGIGILLHELLLSIFQNPAVLGSGMNASEIRGVVIALLLALAVAVVSFRKSGGMAAYVKK